MFSFFAYGADKDFFMDISNDSFGKKSVFEKIYKKNGKTLWIYFKKFFYVNGV